jgi:hypothetical protein
MANEYQLSEGTCSPIFYLEDRGSKFIQNVGTCMQTAQHHIPKDHIFRNHCCENLKSDAVVLSFNNNGQNFVYFTNRSTLICNDSFTYGTNTLLQVHLLYLSKYDVILRLFIYIMTYIHY